MYRFKKHYWLSCCIILIGVIVIMYIPKEAKSEQSFMEPTVFVHGYKGTYHSFGNMLHRFEYKYQWGHKALEYRISGNGAIHVNNRAAKSEGPAFIQVIFDENRASFADSVSYLSAALKHMKEKLQIDSINLVGHSMGGIVALKFIKEQLSSSDDYPNVEKYVAIGSPFDGIYQESYFDIHQDAGAQDLMPHSDALEALYTNEHTFPIDIDVLSIASTGDIIAVPKSVSALENIIPSTQYEKVLIDNRYLGHSDLHESEKVDKLLYTFLFVE